MGEHDIYALPNATNSNGIYEMFGYVNSVSDGIFFPIILLVIWVIVFVTMLAKTTASRALTFTSFFTMILAVPLAILGLLAPSYMYLIILTLAAGVFWMVLENAS